MKHCTGCGLYLHVECFPPRCPRCWSCQQVRPRLPHAAPPAPVVGIDRVHAIVSDSPTREKRRRRARYEHDAAVYNVSGIDHRPGQPPAAP